LTLLHDLRYDRSWEGKTLLGLERAPAAKANHHDREGGLIEHMFEMYDCFIAMRRLIEDHSLAHGMSKAHFDKEFSAERAWRAILNHDIEKAYLTFEEIRTPNGPELPTWKVEYCRNHPLNKLLRGDHKSLWILGQHGIILDEFMMNTLFWAHGGFSEVQMEDVTCFGKLMYLVDEMSGNVLERCRKGTIHSRSIVAK